MAISSKFSSKNAISDAHSPAGAASPGFLLLNRNAQNIIPTDIQPNKR
jgi:hypothetical protein